MQTCVIHLYTQILQTAHKKINKCTYIIVYNSSIKLNSPAARFCLVNGTYLHYI